VAIVPQSPTLFEGTVRENLVGDNHRAAAAAGRGGGGGEDDDEELLSVLRTCRLGVVAERGEPSVFILEPAHVD
jgi:ABC-type multidrug transport system fused ATPase/permease subunit